MRNRRHLASLWERIGDLHFRMIYRKRDLDADFRAGRIDANLWTIGHAMFDARLNRLGLIAAKLD